MSVARFKNITELTVYLDEIETRLTRVEYENESLREALNQANVDNQQLRASINQANTVEQDPRKLLRGLPETGLLSHSFLTRAFAVWGHYFVAQMIIGLGVFVVYMLVVFVVLAAVSGR